MTVKLVLVRRSDGKQVPDLLVVEEFSATLWKEQKGQLWGYAKVSAMGPVQFDSEFSLLFTQLDDVRVDGGQVAEVTGWEWISEDYENTINQADSPFPGWVVFKELLESSRCPWR